MTESRLLSAIARDIVATWPTVYYGARPYLDAMRTMTTMDAPYLCDSASSVVMYFLSNATTWRGPDARRIKAELNGMLRHA